MSKSTEKYGRVIMTANTGPTANPKPPKKLLRQWAKWDSVAKKMFGKPYQALNDQQKTDLHLKIAVQREQARESQKDKDNSLVS